MLVIRILNFCYQDISLSTYITDNIRWYLKRQSVSHRIRILILHQYTNLRQLSDSDLIRLARSRRFFASLRTPRRKSPSFHDTPFRRSGGQRCSKSPSAGLSPSLPSTKLDRLLPHNAPIEFSTELLPCTLRETPRLSLSLPRSSRGGLLFFSPRFENPESNSHAASEIRFGFGTGCRVCCDGGVEGYFRAGW